MTLTINGVNVVPYIAYQGLKWSRNDVESPDAGRTLDGIMHRGRVATKIRLDVTCRPLKKAELHTLLGAIYSETVTVVYDDPQFGMRTATMYSNNNPAEYCMKKKNGEEYWYNITFPLVEV